MYADVFGASECAKGQQLRWRDSVFTYMHWGPAVEQRVQGTRTCCQNRVIEPLIASGFGVSTTSSQRTPVLVCVCSY